MVGPIALILSGANSVNRPLVFPLLAGLDADVGEAVSGATVGSLGSSTSEMKGIPVDIIGDAEGLDVGEPLYNILI